MKCFFAKVGRFFWSWGFLKFCLWAVTLIVLFYAEEDWRGAHAWAATKAEWEAKGETFDFNKFIPPPVPDDQNLAAIPLFKLEPNKDKDYLGNSYFEPVALRQAMRGGPQSNDLPPRGNWMRGELPDMAKVRHTIATDYSAVFKGATPPGDTLAQFDALYPFLTDLRAAAATRPLCRFNLDYTIPPPASRPVGLLTSQIKLSNILTIHAILALDQHQSDLALEDIKTHYKLLSAAKRDPSLVGGLVAIGMNAIGSTAIYDGLALHSWNDSQLAEIDRMLEAIDFLADYQFAMRSEAAGSIANIDYIKTAPRSEAYGYLYGMSDAPPPIVASRYSLLNRFPSLWPGGWWDQNKSQAEDLILNSLSSVDPNTQMAFPELVTELEKKIQRLAKQTDATAPWNVLFILMTSYLPAEPPKFAYAQHWVDETRIAIALERYRLAHNAYPDSLDALVPACINALPHDIMHGQPYHYRLRSDGTFLLYSVGWDQIDDGGKSVFQKGAPGAIETMLGDWVWPTPK